MSTFREFRDAWSEFTRAALPDVQIGWALDPQDLGLKLPVSVELDGPTNISNTGRADYVGYENVGTSFVQGTVQSHRNCSMFLRATSRDHVNSPAELTLERARACLRRDDLRALLSAAQIAVQMVGPTVRYPVVVNGRRESVAAFEIRCGWRLDTDTQTMDADGVLESTELTPEVDGVEGAPFVVDGSE